MDTPTSNNPIQGPYSKHVSEMSDEELRGEWMRELKDAKKAEGVSTEEVACIKAILSKLLRNGNSAKELLKIHRENLEKNGDSVTEVEPQHDGQETPPGIAGRVRVALRNLFGKNGK